MDRVNDYAPCHIAAEFVYLDVAVSLVLRNECYTPDVCLQFPHQQFAIDHCYNYFSAYGLDASVNNEYVAAVNTCIDHRIAVHAEEKSSGAVSDELFVEIDASLHVIIRS